MGSKSALSHACAVAVMARASPAHVHRVAVLMGSAINQDGRSSSLTVRHATFACLVKYPTVRLKPPDTQSCTRPHL